MNIFRREMKALRWGLVFWALGIIFMVGAGMAKYAAYESAGQSVEDVMAAVPKTVQVIFGFSGFDLTTASGFYGVLFLYIGVMAAVHASLLGSNLISKEERDRTSEFLFAKPIPRSTAVTGKLLAGLVNVIILNAVTTVSSLYLVGYFNNGESVSGDIMLMMVGLFLMQLIFFSIGAVVAGIVRKPKSAPSIATSIMFLTFLISYLVNLNEHVDILKYLSPFKYFDAAVLMADGRLDPGYVALSLAIVVLAVAGTYRFYSARDLRV